MQSDMAIRVLLVDDEPVIRENLKKMMARYEEFQVAGDAGTIREALAFLEKQTVELIFMDIQLANSSGFDLARRVEKRYPQTMIIFLTGHADFALEGYDYQPVDFLVKPVSRKRFEAALERVKRRLGRTEEKKPANIGFHTEEGFRIFRIDEIAYLEKTKRKVEITCRNEKKYICGDSLQVLEEMLEEYDFFRCHQSCLVPLDEIVGVRQDTYGRSYLLKLRGVEEELPLSRRKYYELKDILAERN